MAASNSFQAEFGPNMAPRPIPFKGLLKHAYYGIARSEDSIEDAQNAG